MKAFLPKEHGLWTWVCVPLLAAFLLAPGAASAAGVAAVMGGFFAFNATRRQAWGHAAGAAGVAAVAGVGAWALAMRPDVALATGLAGLLGAVGAAALFGGRLPRLVAFEVVGILGLAAIAGGIAVAAGAELGRVVAVELALATWSVLGLWWIRRLMATVLPKRTPWRAGAWVAGALAAACLVVGFVVDAPLAGAVPLLYPLRMVVHRAPTRAVEAMRVGLVELGWALGATALAVLA